MVCFIHTVPPKEDEGHTKYTAKKPLSTIAIVATSVGSALAILAVLLLVVFCWTKQDSPGREGFAIWR